MAGFLFCLRSGLSNGQRSQRLAAQIERYGMPRTENAQQNFLVGERQDRLQQFRKPRIDVVLAQDIAVLHPFFEV
jgi:hypothetical protein